MPKIDKTSYIKKMNFLIFLILLGLADVDLKNAASFLGLSRRELLWNETIEVKPQAGYHLNVKSPHKCGEGQVQALSEQTIQCLMTSFGKQQLQVFVCDDAKTFCRREVLDVQVHRPSNIKEWWNYLMNRF